MAENLQKTTKNLLDTLAERRNVPFGMMFPHRSFPSGRADFSATRRNSRSGFSLVELMVVIAIIALVAALGVGAFNSSGKNIAVPTAAATVSNAVSAARQLAITKNCRTRFIIVTESGDRSEWKLHRYGVLRVKPDTVDLGGTVEWELVGRMDDLPTGVYFREDTHDENDVGPGGTSMFAREENASIAGKSVKYAYIEFLPSGGTSEPTASNIFEVTRAPSADDDIPDNKNYVRIGVAKATGRVKFERPDLL